MKLKIVSLFTILILTFGARADEHVFLYPVDVVRVKDGDTFVAKIHLGLGMSYIGTIRPLGYDAPEIRGVSKQEYERGVDATIYFSYLLENVSHIEVTQKYKDSFGRILARVKLKDGRDVTEIMIKEGYIK